MPWTRGCDQTVLHLLYYTCVIVATMQKCRGIRSNANNIHHAQLSKRCSYFSILALHLRPASLWLARAQQHPCVAVCGEGCHLPSLSFPSPIQTRGALQHVNKLLIHQCAQRGRASQGPARLALSGSDSLHNLGERHKDEQLRMFYGTQCTQPDNFSLVPTQARASNTHSLMPSLIYLSSFLDV